VYDAIVLAGGRAERLGGAAKPQLTVAGTTLLDRVLAAVPKAERVVVVGPEQPAGRPVIWRREDPPGGGPVAAVAAGLPATAAEVGVMLAADLPWIAPAVPLLLAALPDRGAALLMDPAGRANYLASAWRRVDLAAALTAIGPAAGASMRALAARVPLTQVQDRDGWGRDCDTWQDLAQARAQGRDADA
jgi:molybdopterin-guanine dinucleotide biosynthesis protein A